LEGITFFFQFAKHAVYEASACNDKKVES